MEQGNRNRGGDWIRRARPKALLGLWALLGLGCGPSAGGDWLAAKPRQPHELYRGLMDGGRVVVCVPDDGLEQAAHGAAKRFAAAGLAVSVERISEEPPRAPGARVLVLTREAPDPEGWLDRLGVEWLDASDGGLPAGFRFLGREYRRGEDWLRFVVADPVRTGLPLAIAVGNRSSYLAREQRCFDLGWFFGFTAFRAGELERSGRLVWNSESGYRPVVERDLFEDWAKATLGRVSAVRRGFTFSVPRALSVQRADGYVARSGAALARGRALSGIELPEDGAPLTPLVAYLHEDARTMGQLVGQASLGLVRPGALLVHVLLDPELPDDGGAALVSAELEQLLGPPALPWLPRAVGLLCAGTYWGRPLERWGAWLAEGKLGLPPAELLDGPRDSLDSPHRLDPLRALWLGWVLERAEPGLVVDLWRGQAELAVDPGAQAGFLAHLGRLAERERGWFAQVRSRRAEGLAALAHLGGAHCDIAEDATWFDSEPQQGLLDLAQRGARAVLFAPIAWAPDPKTAPVGVALGPRSLRGDLEWMAAVGAARRAGLASILAPELLKSEHGHLLGDTILTRADEWEQAFGQLLRASLHYALLAELAGAEVFVLGSELQKATRNVPDPRILPGVAPLRRAAWLQWIETVRGATSSALTYAAASGDEPDWTEFWDQLDYVGLMAYSPLVPPGAGAAVPTHRELVVALGDQFHHLAQVAARAGRPGLVLGVGYPATDRAWARPWTRGGETDAGAQERFYRALAEAFQGARGNSPHLRGLVFWSWRADQRATSARDFAVDGRPAERHLLTLFGGP